MRNVSLSNTLCGFAGLLLSVLSAGCPLFPTEAGEDLAHCSASSLQPGDTLPDLVLQALDGTPVLLSSLVRSKPLVVRLGSYSCPVFSWLIS